MNGRASFIRKDDQGFAELDSEWNKVYWFSTLTLGDTVLFIRVEPTHFLAYATHPEKFGDP